MPETVRRTITTRLVLQALLDADGQDLWGWRVCHLTGLKSGTVYPILVRLEERGWTRARWEDTEPAVEGRPKRRYWELTEAGRAAAMATVEGRSDA